MIVVCCLYQMKYVLCRVQQAAQLLAQNKSEIYYHDADTEWDQALVCENSKV